jgi:hypothetical protein
MPDQTTKSPEAVPDAGEFSLSVLTKVLFIFAGVVLPAICFLLAYPERPEWQSGATGAYAKLYLSREGSLPFYPLLLYNMVSMSLLIGNPRRFVEKAWLRFGVYSGVIVALGYWGLFVLGINENDSTPVFATFMMAGILSFFGTAIPWAILFGLYAAATKDKRAIWLSVAIAAIAVLCFKYVIFLSLLCSTPWAVASYATMSYLVIRHRREKGFQFSLAQLLGVVTWFAGYCAAWRVAYLAVLAEYAKLPTEPPQGCYLCTAAARGHRRFVKSEEYLTAAGTTCRVNDQLRCFKAFELLLKKICPRLHWLCRRVYDAVGPTLARAIDCPLLADTSYAAIKPLEWLCRVLLRLLVSDRGDFRRLYR